MNMISAYFFIGTVVSVFNEAMQTGDSLKNSHIIVKCLCLVFGHKPVVLL